MSKERSGKLSQRKKKRMPVIAINGIVILIPAAYFLNQWAMSGVFDSKFYLLQAVELTVGFINLSLMVMNIADGKKIASWKKVTA